MKSAEGKALVIKRKELELERAKIRIRMDYTSDFKLRQIKQINRKINDIGKKQRKLRKEMSQKKMFSYDGILWFPKSEFKQAQKQVSPSISKSEVLFRKTCLWCGNILPKYRSKYCSDNHRDEYYKAKRNLYKRYR